MTPRSLSVVTILITVVLVHAGKRQRRLADALRQAAIDPLTGLQRDRTVALRPGPGHGFGGWTPARYSGPLNPAVPTR